MDGGVPTWGGAVRRRCAIVGPVTRALILALVRFALETFYRTRKWGHEVPAEGPLILVANHPNALVDPALLMEATPRPLRFLGKEPLLRMPVIGFIVRRIGLIPVYRTQDGADPKQNAAAFEAVRAALHQGDAIAIFPEGKSHDEPALQRLKTGAARMALDANPEQAGEVRIVPVGLVYSDKGYFRSKAAIWIGEPVDGGDLRASITDPDSHWSAVETLTERINGSLAGVTINLDRWEDWDLLRLAQRIWRPARGSRRVERMATLADAAAHLRERDPARLASLTRRIDALRLSLDELGLPADRLDQHYRTWGAFRYLARQLATFVIAGPIALAAMLFWLPPYLLVRTGTRFARVNGDLLATVKILASATIFTLWLIGVAVWLALESSPWFALGLLGLAPPLGRWSLPLVENHLRLIRELRLFLRHVTSDALRAELTAERDALAAEFDALEAELVSATRPEPERR